MIYLNSKESTCNSDFVCQFHCCRCDKNNPTKGNCAVWKENAPKESGTIRRCNNFIRVSKTVLEEVCLCGGGLCGSMYVPSMPSVSDNFLFTVGQNVTMLSSFSSTMSACILLSQAIIIMDKTSENVSQTT